ncbi:MAG TPA: hypothetical protein VE987_11895 [Polyangiaceae bacterium]|nr:hypothetical protein [Polyangiaceae bacterium]
MDRPTLAAALAVACVTITGRAWGDIAVRPARADVDADRAAGPAGERHRAFGMSMDLGVPDGAALGLAVRPRFDWLRLGVAATHNGMAPGVRLGVTLDPIDFPLAPTFTVEGGHAWPGPVPFVKNAPTLGYDYANLHVGVEIGRRATFRFFLRGGVSWLDLTATHVQNAPAGGSGIGDPSFSGWLAPSGKLGFSTYF